MINPIESNYEIPISLSSVEHTMDNNRKTMNIMDNDRKTSNVIDNSKPNIRFTSDDRDLIYANEKLFKMQLEHKMDMETKNQDVELTDRGWRSCCFELHKDSSLFFGKLIVSLTVIGVCSYQLINNTNNCTAQIAYSSILSLIIGTWMKV